MSYTESNVRGPGSSTDGLLLCPATDAYGNPAKLGAFGKTPAVQPSGAGDTHTVTAGATTAVFTNTSFDGSVGTAAYTVGDIVLALKTLGLIAT